VFSTGAEEYRVTFTPDGSTAYFARGDAFFPVSRQATILVSHIRDGAWTQPTVAPFSGQYPDLDPFVTPDGRRLFFSSIRPVDGQQRRDIDLWMVERRGDGSWSAPVNLGAGVNSDRDELYASVARDGTLFFASDRPGGSGGWEIYSATRTPTGAYTTAVNIGAPVNSTAWEFNPVITADGRTLIFTSLNRPGGKGLGDLYRSDRAQDGWTAPQLLDTLINTADDEYHASLSPSGTELYFVRRIARPVGGGTPNGDLWRARWPLLGSTR
jgi:hypothetical protein